MKYYLFFAAILLIYTNLMAQNHEVQIGFGVQSIDFYRNTFANDTLTFGGNPIANPDLALLFRYQRPISTRLDFQTGFTLMMSSYGYQTGFYLPDLGTFASKVNTVRLLNAVIPIDVKLNISKAFYLKAGLPLTLKFVTRKSTEYYDDDWDDVPYLYDIYEQLDDTYHRVMLNYGIGAGVEIWKLNLELYLQNSLSPVSKAVEFGEEKVRIYSRTRTVFLTLAYRFKIKR